MKFIYIYSEVFGAEKQTSNNSLGRACSISDTLYSSWCLAIVEQHNWTNLVLLNNKVSRFWVIQSSRPNSKPYLLGDFNSASIFKINSPLIWLSVIFRVIREELNCKDSNIAVPPTSVIEFLHASSSFLKWVLSVCWTLFASFLTYH